MRLALLAVILAPLAACATGPGGDRYHDELERLRQDCQDRGGIISPTGVQSGRPNTDYVCELRGGSGLTRD